MHIYHLRIISFSDVQFVVTTIREHRAFYLTFASFSFNDHIRLFYSYACKMTSFRLLPLHCMLVYVNLFDDVKYILAFSLQTLYRLYVYDNIAFENH